MSMLTVAEIARLAHETNRVFCMMIGEEPQPAWGNAPEWQRGSAIAGVNAHLSNPNMTPEDSHNCWMSEKVASGWTYGPVKDAEAKTHPCMVPYDELPVEQKIKDHLFRAIVHAASAYGVA